MNEAIKAWSIWFANFRVDAEKCLGMTLPGFERYPLTARMIAKIRGEK